MRIQRVHGPGVAMRVGDVGGLILEPLSLTCEAVARISQRLQSLLAALGAISGDGGGDEKIEGRCGSSRAIRVLSPNSLARPAVRTRVWTPTGWFCLRAVQWPV
jgi:hypothetical protein